MSAPSAASPAASADRRPQVLQQGPLTRMAQGTLAMAQAEMRKLRHDHLDIVTRSVQPLCGCSSSAPRCATTTR